MRYVLALTAAALFAAALPAADPPITFQTHPVERVLTDMRSAADLIGGEKAVKAVNAGIKDKLGEKGFEGLELSKPVVGYVILAPKLEDTVAVVALPVTNEKDFIALCDRWNGGAKAKDLGKGIWELPPLDPAYKARMRFSGGYAYIAYGNKPESALDEKALVAPNKIYDPAEQAAFAGKLHFDRLTPEVKTALVGLLMEAKKSLLDAADPDLPNQAAMKPAIEELEKLLKRYLLLLGGADNLALRLNLAPATGEVVAEATLTPKPNTELAKQIAARKPAENRFAGLITPDTVAGVYYTTPLFAEEISKAYAALIEQQQKELAQVLPPGAKATIDELFKGQARTMKAGEGDLALAVRGPDKDGYFSAVGAMSFEDPSALEKAFKKYMDDDNPLGDFGAFKWEADKEGKVAIHTFKVGVGLLPAEFTLFGENLTVAFAFAPKAIYVAVGPDPVKTVKEALKAKPAVAPALDVVVNPARLSKFVQKAGGEGLDVEKVIGREDKLISAASLRVTSGKDLKVRLALSLRIIPRALFSSYESAEGGVKPVEVPPPPAVERK
jgi:hypothetical protein